MTPQPLPHVCCFGLAQNTRSSPTLVPGPTPVPSPQGGAGHVSLLLSLHPVTLSTVPLGLWGHAQVSQARLAGWQAVCCPEVLAGRQGCSPARWGLCAQRRPLFCLRSCRGLWHLSSPSASTVPGLAPHGAAPSQPSLPLAQGRREARPWLHLVQQRPRKGLS